MAKTSHGPYNFYEIPVSTQTYVARSNITDIKLDQLLNDMAMNDKVIGIKKNFLNCVSITILVEKKINIKIFRNGSFQMTGCKHYDHANQCIKVIIQEFKLYPSCYTLRDQDFHVYIISAMRNVNFELGFKINREALGVYIHENTDFYVPPMTKGYMGVKINIPLDNVNDLKIFKLTFPKDGPPLETTTNYLEFFSKISPDEKKLKQPRQVSISVFQNGKVLMSGIDLDYQIDHYNWFVNLIHEIKPMVCMEPTLKKSFKNRVG